MYDEVERMEGFELDKGESGRWKGGGEMDGWRR